MKCCNWVVKSCTVCVSPVLLASANSASWISNSHITRPSLFILSSLPPPNLSSFFSRRTFNPIRLSASVERNFNTTVSKGSLDWARISAAAVKLNRISRKIKDSEVLLLRYEFIRLSL